VSCGAALGGPYCAACGQRSREGRITARHVAAQVAGELSPVDRGIVFTFLGVLRRPGVVARDYVEGRTVRYVGPVKYFLLLVGAAQILALRVSFLREMAEGFVHGWHRDDGGGGGSEQTQLLAFVSKYFVSLAAAMVPPFALATRLLFRRARLNYAEHVVLALYTAAQQLAMLVVVAWLIDLVRVRGLEGVWLLAAFAYQAWALHQFTGLSRAQSAWRTVAAALLAVVATTVVAGVGAAIVDIARRHT
jgi:hypothetical protein